MNLESRILRACENQSGAHLVIRHEDIRWLTGFSGSTSSAVLHADKRKISLFVDGRYVERAQQEVSAAASFIDVVQVSHPSSVEEEIAKILDGAQLFVDAGHITVEHSRSLEAHVQIEFQKSFFSELRRIKDQNEIDLMARCAQIADDSLKKLLEDGIVGHTEREVARRLDSLMRIAGADDVGFDTIIATGPHGARPHHEPSDHVIEHGHMVIMDFGAELDGYRSDMTRTIRVGQPSAELEDMFEIVREAQAAGVAAIAPGVEGSQIDAAVRAVFAREGVEHEYVHGTGHGVGLVIHEEPIFSPRCSAVLQESEVVTVEPGLYRKGVGGVRIEDLVVVTGTGCQILTNSPKDLSCPRSLRTI